MSRNILVAVLSSALALLTACPGPAPESPPSTDAGTSTDAGASAPDAGEPLPTENRPPLFPPLDPVSIEEGATLEVALTASDPDGDTLTWALLTSTGFAALEADRLLLTPGYADSGDVTLTLAVSDGRLSVERTLEVSVINVNRAPLFASLPMQAIVAGTPIDLAVEATDPDGDAVTLSLDATAPDWATLDATTLSLSPPAGTSGTYAITLIAEDDGAPSLTGTATLDVVVTSQPPALTDPRQLDPFGAPLPAGSTSTTTPQFVATIDDPDDEEVWLDVEVVPAADSFTGTPTTSLLGGEGERRIDVASLSAGAWKWQLRARDASGATSGWMPFHSGNTAFTIQPGSVTGSVEIEAGAAATSQSAVALTLTGTSNNGTVTHVRLSNDGVTWSAPEPFTATRAGHVLAAPETDEVKTVYVAFIDSANAVHIANDSIRLDTLAPLATLDIANGQTATNTSMVTLTLTASEPGPLTQAISVAPEESAVVPPAAADFTAFQSPVTLDLGAEGRKRILVWLRDEAGNVSAPPARYAIHHDASPPQVTEVFPPDGVSLLSRSTRPRITFNEPVNPQSLNITASGVSGTVQVRPDGRSATFVPTGLLPANASVSVSVSGATDLAGNALSTYSWQFTTGDAVMLSAETAPVHRDFEHLKLPSGTLVVWQEHDGMTAYLTRWAFRSAATGTWRSGVVRSARVTELQSLHPWADGRFALASNGGGPGGTVTIFDGFEWTPHPAPRQGIFLSNGEAAAVIDTSTYPNVQASTWDGATWSANSQLGTWEGAGLATATSPKGLAVLYHRATTYPTSQLYLRRFEGGAWQPEEVVATTGSTPFLVDLAGSDTTWAARWFDSSGRTQAAVRDPATGTWSVTVLSTSEAPGTIRSNGKGFAAEGKYSGRLTVHVHDGTQWLSGAHTFGQSPSGYVETLHLRTSGTGYAIGYAESGAVKFSVYSPVSGWGAVETLDTGAAFGELGTSDDLLGAVWVKSGDVFASAYSNGSWSPAQKVSVDRRSGPVTVAPFAGGLGFLFGDGRPVAIRSFVPASGMSAHAPLAEAQLSGATFATSLAFTPGGQGFALWEQFDGGTRTVFAASHDGSAWSAPFRVGDGSDPMVATNGTTFAFTYRHATRSDNWVNGWSATQGLGTPVLAFGEYVSTQARATIASGGVGYRVLWEQQRYIGTAWTAHQTSSADGFSWSAPSFGVAAGRGAFSGGAAGWVAANRNWLYEDLGTGWNTTTQHSTSARPCAVAAGSTFAAVCAPTTTGSVTLFTWENAAWTSFSAGFGAATAAIATNGTTFRASYGTETRTWSAGTWSAPETILPLRDTLIVSDGSEYAIVGLHQPQTSTSNLLAYRTTNGVLQPVQTIEGVAAPVLAQAAAHGGGKLHLVWVQDEGTGTPVLLGRGL